MRRTDRERKDQEFFDQVFDKAEVLFLAMLAGDTTYCLPLNFARKGDVIYIHSALEGKKLNCIRHNPRVAFSLAVDIEIDRKKATTYYKSICGNGKAYIIEDMEEKRTALDLIGQRYDSFCRRPSPDANLKRTAIIRIDIEELSGKNCVPASDRKDEE